jgi:hypothetical protein
MSTYQFKKIVKEKVIQAGLKYLLEKKNEPGKQTKIAHLQYEKLKMQEYLLDGNKNTEISKLIFKARGRNLDIKTHKKWKYKDNLCIGCNIRIETEEELLSCPGFGEQGEKSNEIISFSLVFGDAVNDMIRVAEKIRKRLKRREKILEEIT